MRNHRSAVTILIAFAESAVETLSGLPYVARKQSRPLVLFLLIFVTASQAGLTMKTAVESSWCLVK
jgi:hypothetical protein